MLARAFSLMLLTAMASDGWAATRERKVNVDDMLRITVKGNPGLSIRCRVDPTGGIDYPYVGHLIVRGLKPADVGTLIANRLKDAEISVAPVSVVIEAEEKGSRGLFPRLGQFATALATSR
jgi:protein involved in polysaccharide export with SLBB domain